MKPQAMFSWMHPALEIRETDRYGKSVFACSYIPADTRLAVFGGYVMRIADEPVFENIGADFALQIDDEFFIGAHSEADLDDAQYFNHSCNPNAGLRGQHQPCGDARHRAGRRSDIPLRDGAVLRQGRQALSTRMRVRRTLLQKNCYRRRLATAGVAGAL